MIGAITAGLFSTGAAAGGGTSYESIATANGTGSSGVITFSSIPSTFKHLQIRMTGRGTVASTNIEGYITFNGSSSSYYQGHQLFGDGATAYSQSSSGTTSGWSTFMTANSATANVNGVGIVDILDYADTNKYKTTRTLTGYDLNGSGLIIFRSNLWQNTAAINSISFTTSAANFDSTTKFALYGIRG